MSIAESCSNTDAGCTCVCLLIGLALFVAAYGAVLRLSAARAIVFFLRFAWRAAYRSIFFGSATRGCQNLFLLNVRL